MIVKVANEQALTLDLTNFVRTGTVLCKYFEPLKAIRNLKIIVNEDAKKQMKEIGFEEEQIVSP